MIYHICTHTWIEYRISYVYIYIYHFICIYICLSTAIVEKQKWPPPAGKIHSSYHLTQLACHFLPQYPSLLTSSKHPSTGQSQNPDILNRTPSSPMKLSCQCAKNCPKSQPGRCGDSGRLFARPSLDPGNEGPRLDIQLDRFFGSCCFTTRACFWEWITWQCMARNKIVGLGSCTKLGDPWQTSDHTSIPIITWFQVVFSNKFSEAR